MTTKTAKPVRHWHSCGRGFHNKAGMLNHGRKCPVEVAWHDAWVKAIEEGRNPMDDLAAMVQMTRQP